MQNRGNIFLIAGRTGGPIVPLIAIAKNLENTPIILGIKNGVETKLAGTNNYKIEYLPEAKFTLGSFKKESLNERLKGLLELFKMGLRFVFSFFKSIFLILKYKPKAVFSAGSFLAVPVIFATCFLRFFGLKTKIITHQQDPLPGLANKLTFPLSDLKTCVFEYSRNFNGFKDAEIIPNPINVDLFKADNLATISGKMKIEDKELYNFISNKNKPILLVMGGGSGSEFLNKVVENNLEQLIKKFKIVHLTGALQNKKNLLANNGNYISRDFLNYEYSAVLNSSDIVLARPGLGTITELLFLKKPAVLVPIAYSHQEKNADEVKEDFKILKQTDQNIDWAEELYGTFTSNLNIKSGGVEEKLLKYYNKVKSII